MGFYVYIPISETIYKLYTETIPFLKKVKPTIKTFMRTDSLLHTVTDK
jgi:hypothetical protein